MKKPDKSKMIPAQRRWLQDDHQFHGKLSPMFELRELPGWHEEAREVPLPPGWRNMPVPDPAGLLIEEDERAFINPSLTEAISKVLDLAEQCIIAGIEPKSLTDL